MCERSTGRFKEGLLVAFAPVLILHRLCTQSTPVNVAVIIRELSHSWVSGRLASFGVTAMGEV